MPHSRRTRSVRVAWYAAALPLAFISACSSSVDRVVAPAPARPSLATAAAAGGVVISQIYGGGGNSGSTYTNDFVELHNNGSATVSLAGWSVQYASANGSSWQVTTLGGSIAPGGYYLVQESKGTGGTTALPTPDATGGILMSATAGKVALVSNTTALSGSATTPTAPLAGTTCPTSTAGVVDFVGFGSGSSGATCYEGSGPTPSPSNTNAVLRGTSGNGTVDTDDNKADFAAGAPNPRNTSSPTVGGDGGTTVGPLDHVALNGPTTVAVGGTIQLAASAQDATNQPLTTATYTWQSSDPSVASVDAAGKVAGLTASATPVVITVTATDASSGTTITKTAQLSITVVAPTIGWIDVSSSSTSFPPGFQTQLFFTARVSSGGTIIPATFDVQALDPSVATYMSVGASTGIVTGVSASTTKPRFLVTATPIGGGTPYQFTASPVTIETPVVAPASTYSTNDEFGDPAAASPGTPDAFLITRNQYTLSYNESRGTPNWVTYELDARQIVPGQDRCNCFTADPLLPAAKQIFTSDYTNGGYDRGHMTRSFDRTAANVDNATTFYLTNIVPQTAALNQGPWASFENVLGDSAQAGRAVYIATGPLYVAGKPLVTLKGEGKVAVPDSTWKVAFIGPDPGGVPFNRSSITTWDDLANTTVIAVNMPNDSSIRNVPWQTYITTADRIEASTGYNVLSLLQTAYQNAVEAGDHPPVAAFGTSANASEGQAVTFDASASTDPDLAVAGFGEALTYTWMFGDGATATGKVVTHTYADNGSYTATLTVTDRYGWPRKVSHVVAVANSAPQPTLTGPSGTVAAGQNASFAVKFSDAGTKDGPWRISIDWGDGTAPYTATSSAQLTAFALTRTHAFASPGTYQVKLTITDKDSAAQSVTAPVTVQ